MATGRRKDTMGMLMEDNEKDRDVSKDVRRESCFLSPISDNELYRHIAGILYEKK